MNKIKVLGSGSSGNCYSLEINDEILLLDAGFKYKDILKFIDYRVDKVTGCLITHLHNDHSKGVKDLVENGINVYALTSVFEHKDVLNHRCKVVKANSRYIVGNFNILAFELEHDVENVGFLIKHVPTGETILYITDTYYVKYRFKNVNHILVECNYSKEIIDRTLEDKMFLRNRVVQSHFELQNCIDFLKASDLGKLKTLTLVHLSNANSDAELFKSEVEKAIGHPVNIAKKGLEIYL